MYYSIRHSTKFHYSAPIRESLLELRMQPGSDGNARCLWFDLQISPRPRVGLYRDCWNNLVHFFDIPGMHEELHIATRAIMEVSEPLQPNAMAQPSWNELDEHTASGDFWDFLLPSKFARPTELLRSLVGEWQFERRGTPLEMLEELRTNIYRNFAYAPSTTRADSPIDEALDSRRGVCQDFTHIFIAMARELGVPCRYVSGYLHHAETDRSLSNATHAWAQAWLPTMGWVGFDPTNDSLSGERHIVTAIGRDYADVPPTRGVFKGRAITELTVEVEVEKIATLPPEALAPTTGTWAMGGDGVPVSGTTGGSSALSAVWPPPAAVFIDDVSEQAQQQQQ